jgi:hypothetical protein
MSATYSLYGLTLRANLPIPTLESSSVETSVDLVVQLGLDPPWLAALRPNTLDPFYVSSDLELWEPTLKVWKLPGGDHFLLRYQDGTQFVIDRRATVIWATWPEDLTIDDTATYLLGPVMGFALLLRATVCLHASAVAIDGQAVALVGQAGAGKSTTAAAFARAGFKILSDDVVALSDRNGAFFVQSAYPCIRLWPSSVAALFGRADALPLLTPNWDKRYLDLTDDGERFQDKALPLEAIYVLGERDDDLRRPMVEDLLGKEGLVELITNTYVSYLMDTAMRAHQFRTLNRLVQRVTLRRVVAHSDPAHLSKLCEVILEDFQSANASSLTA